MRKLLIATALAALSLPAVAKTPAWMVKSVGQADADMAYKNIIEWERNSRADVPRTKRSFPRAISLIKQGNALLVSDPTCANMRAASKLLEKAENIYIAADARGQMTENEMGGDVRHLSRRVSWLKDVADGGDCKK